MASSRQESEPVESSRESDAERAMDTGRDIDFQEREWRAQRVAWVVMAVVVLAAVVGLLGGSGPLVSAQSRATDGSLSVTYDRLERHHEPSQMTIEVAPSFVEEGEIRLWVDVDYMQAIGLESVLPEPESVELESGRMVYVFTAAEASSPLTITISYEHDGFWTQQAQLGLVNGAPVAFRQFVFP